jgi:hypothetical protein
MLNECRFAAIVTDFSADEPVRLNLPYTAKKGLK